MSERIRASVHACTQGSLWNIRTRCSRELSTRSTLITCSAYNYFFYTYNYIFLIVATIKKIITILLLLLFKEDAGICFIKIVINFHSLIY